MSESNRPRLLDAVRLYADIAVLRRGPEDLPVSVVLLLLTIAAYLLITLGLSSAMPTASGNRLDVLALASAFLLAWYWVVMRLAGRPERFLQTACAVFGYRIVIAPATVAFSAQFLKYTATTAPQVPAWFAFLAVALAIWTLTINGRILRSATGWPMFSCIALVLLQELVGALVLFGLFADKAAS